MCRGLLPVAYAFGFAGLIVGILDFGLRFLVGPASYLFSLIDEVYLLSAPTLLSPPLPYLSKCFPICHLNVSLIYISFLISEYTVWVCL